MMSVRLISPPSPPAVVSLEEMRARRIKAEPRLVTDGKVGRLAGSEAEQRLPARHQLDNGLRAETFDKGDTPDKLALGVQFQMLGTNADLLRPCRCSQGEFR